MKFHFTKAAIIAAPVGTHYDTKQSGLCVHISATTKKYGVYVSIRNTPTRRSLGDVNDRSVEAVRAEAARVIAGLRETPKQRQRRLTVGDVLTMYNEYLEVDGARDSRYMERVFRLHWSHLLPCALADVTPVEVTTHHNKVAKAAGPAAARYAVTCLRTLYNYAGSLDLTTANPAKRVRTAPAKSRDTLREYMERV